MVEEMVQKALRPFDIRKVMESLKFLNSGALEDVLNTNGCAYYQWTANLIADLEPKQVVELGAAMGVWDLMVLSALPKEAKLYAITLPEHGLEFSFVDKEYANFVPLVGDDLHKELFPCDLDQTDLWFFDSKHELEHLRKELDLYSPHFKKGTVVLVDDIHSFGIEPAWEELKGGKWGKLDCYDATDPLHWSGFGVCQKS